jgi:hypothetical protein
MSKQQRASVLPVDGESKYFDLHTRGFGYLNRVRWVDPKGGRRADRFLACEINALHGDTSQPEYTKFDVIVSGKDAIELVDRHGEDVEAGRKVLVWFTIGDIWSHAYMREELDRKTRRPTGKEVAAAVIKGRLLRIARIKVDGEVVYEADKPEAEMDEREAESGADAVPESADEQSTEPPHRRGTPANDADERPAARRVYGNGTGGARSPRQGSYSERRTGTHG